MDGLVIDNFAGGGGASTGIAMAIGRDPDIAINHSPQAVAMHKANHPATRHLIEDVWAVDPAVECAGRPVDLAWFSPDCTHFSRAKGGKPRSKKTRSLAWAVVRWAKAVRPAVIMLENVEEFQTWGPLDDTGKPLAARSGEEFRRWLGELSACGYAIEYRTLVAADYGTPTTRKRLFLVARRDGRPIVWPEATHGRGRSSSWRTAAEVIDWTLPTRSVFGRARPLAEATLRRIATGVQRYVIGAARPFIVPVTHTKGGNRVHGIDQPLRTVTTAKGGEFALVSPTLISTGYGEREGQAPRVPGLHKPLGTVVAGGQKHALVAAFLSKHYGGVVGHGVERPLGTVTTQDHHALTSVQLELPGALEASFVSKFYGTSTGSPADEPLPTVTTGGGRGGGHLAEVRAFLVKYYGSDGSPVSQQQDLFAPLHTVTTKARFGLVTIEGQDYAITDIGMRMLAPHELFAAQGFPSDYRLDVDFSDPRSGRQRKLTKTELIDLCGNSVCAVLACALVRANLRRESATNDGREAFTGAA